MHYLGRINELLDTTLINGLLGYLKVQRDSRIYRDLNN